MIVAFAAGSVAGLALIVRHGWAARSRTIPFAPFLALGGAGRDGAPTLGWRNRRDRGRGAPPSTLPA